MKRGIICALIVVFISIINTAAQNPNLERLNAYKIGFITQRLNLTPQEAEKFWPVYNEYQDMKYKIQLEKVEISRNFNQNGLKMSDRDLIEAGDKLVSLEMREASLAQEFHNKIKGILSPEKVLRLYQAENQYKLQLLKELQQRRQSRNN